MIDALLRERVRQFGDITAITDPLTREALLDGPFRTLTWPGLDERIAVADDRAGLAAHLADFSPDPNDCVTICWTSGTESTPKGVPRTHYDWMAMCTGTVEGPDLTADDVLLNPFPMVNMAGINGMFLPWLKV